jgi:tRNA pseudouridine38-40 synthase
MTKIVFITSYDGSNYCGWQRQNQPGQISIASCFESAFEKLLNEKLTVYSSGRTDAGVHAKNQWCHFTSSKPKIFFENKDLGWALKSFLPKDIVVKKAFFAPLEFHSTRSALKKTYRYWIWNSQIKNPLFIRYSNWQRKKLNLDYLNECASYLQGEHDFKSFQSVGTEIENTVRRLYSIDWQYKSSQNHIEFSVTGNGFLKQMVRNLVGTMIHLHRHEMPASKIKHILEAYDRRQAFAPAEPQGLFLDQVFYPKALTEQLVPLRQSQS